MAVDFSVNYLLNKLEFQGEIDTVKPSRISLKCPHCLLTYWIIPAPTPVIGHPRDWNGRYISREDQDEAIRHLKGCMEHKNGY